MRRTRAEAEAIARQRHQGVGEEQLLILTSHYMRVQDWCCSNCANVGTVIRIDGVVRTSDCICAVLRRKRLAVEKILGLSNIPKRYLQASFKNWFNCGSSEEEIELNNNSFRIVQAFSNNLSKMMKTGHGLYLAGPNGIGKTFLACAIAIRAAHCGFSVRYYTMSTIIQTEIRGWRDPESAAVMNGIKKAQLLIIDDIDKVYRTTTGIESALFDNLLRERLQANRPCIFTSNRTVMDAGADYSQSVASMLVEHCAELIFVGKDHRKNMSDTIIKEITDGS